VGVAPQEEEVLADTDRLRAAIARSACVFFHDGSRTFHLHAVLSCRREFRLPVRVCKPGRKLGATMRVAIVTGSARLFGSETCKKFHAEGFDVEDNRPVDHIQWISNVAKFQNHRPACRYHYDLEGILREIHDAFQVERTARV
jgi:hypothetical protein